MNRNSLILLELILFIMFTGNIFAANNTSINENAEKSNKGQENILDSVGKKSSRLPERLPDLVVPQEPATVVGQRNFAIPFNITSSKERIPVSVELLCSENKGDTWFSSGKIQLPGTQKEFFFRARSDGEFWFVLRSVFQNGESRTSSVQKIVIKTEGVGPVVKPEETPQSAQKPAAAPPKDNALPSASSLPVTNSKPDAKQPVVAAKPSLPENKKTEGASTDKSLNSSSLAMPDQNNTVKNNNTVAKPAEKKELNSIAMGKSNEEALRKEKLNRIAGLTQENADSSAEKSDSQGAKTNPLAKATPGSNAKKDEIPKIGEVKTVSLGKTAMGEPTIMVRWYRPEDLGLKTGMGGTVRIERSTSPNGPWVLVVESLQDDQPGYWWKATEQDAVPFYIRTVARNANGQESTNAMAQKIDVSARLKGLPLDSSPMMALMKSEEKTADPSETKQPGKTRSSIPTWETPPTPEQSLAHSNTNDMGGKNTANESMPFSNVSLEKKGNDNSSASSSIMNKTAAVGSMQSKYDKPAANNAPRYSGNPGVVTLNPLFTEGFGAIFRPQKTRSSKTESVPGVNGPTTPTKKRSIFTPPRQTVVPPQSYSNEYNEYGMDSVPGGMQSGIMPNGMQGNMMPDGTPIDGNMPMNSSEVIYLDQNGNRIANPFASGQPMENGAFLPNGSNEMQGGVIPDNGGNMGNMPMMNSTAMPNDIPMMNGGPYGGGQFGNGQYNGGQFDNQYNNMYGGDMNYVQPIAPVFANPKGGTGVGAGAGTPVYPGP